MKLIDTDPKSITIYTIVMGVAFVVICSIFISQLGFYALFNKFSYKEISIRKVSVVAIGRAFDRSLLIEDEDGNKYVSKCIGLPDNISCNKHHDDTVKYYSGVLFMDMGDGNGFILKIFQYDDYKVIENKLDKDGLVSYYRRDNLLILLLVYSSMFLFIVPVSIYLVQVFLFRK